MLDLPRSLLEVLAPEKAHLLSEPDGLCLLANYSEQFSLTDAERDAIARTLLERVAGRLPVIVTTSHYSVRVAAARSRAAQDMGAAMVMIMPPFSGATLTVPGPAMIGYFKQVADAIHIPVMVQDAPLPPTPLPVSLLIDLVDRTVAAVANVLKGAH